MPDGCTYTMQNRVCGSTGDCYATVGDGTGQAGTSTAYNSDGSAYTPDPTPAPSAQSATDTAQNACLASGKCPITINGNVTCTQCSDAVTKYTTTTTNPDNSQVSTTYTTSTTFNPNNTATSTTTATTTTTPTTGPATTTISTSTAQGPTSTYCQQNPGDALCQSNQQFPSDYAKSGEAEAAQVETRAKLQAIQDALTQQSDAPTDPTLPDAASFNDAFFKGTFDGLKSWTLPAHASTCPTTTFDYSLFGQSFHLVMDAHCTITEQIRAVLSTAAVVMWTVLALFIVLGA